MSRRRFVYTQGGTPLPEPIEVSEDWTNESMTGTRRSEEEVYGHLVAQDGTDISTRKRHREYMKANGLTLADDFKETWAKAQKERDAYRRGERTPEQRREMRETVARAMYERRKP